MYTFLILALAVSCKNPATTTNSDAAVKVQNKVVDEAVMASNLYQFYTANPSSTLEKNNNALIEYAVNNKLNCKRTPLGVFYVTHQEGEGPLLQSGSPVSAHYRGSLLDGTEFDSSYKKNKPLNFKVGQMIKGWNEWLTMSNPGTKATLLIPSHLAYGERGFTSIIPPNAPLVFEVELLKQ